MKKTNPIADKPGGSIDFVLGNWELVLEPDEGEGSFRVDRGGGWASRTRRARSSNRVRRGPSSSGKRLGFRLVRNK